MPSPRDVPETCRAGTATVRVARTTPGDGLYRPPPLRGDEPLGSVLRSEDIWAPEGMRARAILYVSTGLDTARTAVSAIVLAPDGPAHPTARPVLAWAHFTAGLAARCAPSRAGVTDELLAITRPFLAEGFVVVATDYEGLGTPGPHPYMVGVSAGRSVLDSIRAVSRPDGSGDGSSVAVLGLSQGGHAALWAAELAPRYAPELDIRAVAAVAPGADLAGIARRAFGPEGAPVARLNVVMALSAWHEVYGLPLDTLLTAKGRELAVSLQSTCPDFSAPPSERLLVADPASEPGWRERVAANAPGGSRAEAPILIVQGTRDEQVPLETTLSAVSRLREVGDDVELRVLEGGDHESGLFGPGSLDELRKWIVERVGDPATVWPTGADHLARAGGPDRDAFGQLTELTELHQPAVADAAGAAASRRFVPGTVPPGEPANWMLRRLDGAPAHRVVVLVGLLLIAVVAVAVAGSHPAGPARPIGLVAPLPPPATPSVAPFPSRERWPEAPRATQLAFSGSDFYSVPRPLASSEPGELVYVQRMGDPADGRLYRVLYHSRSVSDHDIAVSGTIWIPASPPPPGGYPIVSFAMADDGSGDMCAMSQAWAGGIDASYGGLMSLFLDAGVVVAFTDYEGLGTPDPYPFGVLDSAANAMLDAARAARELLGSAASDRVVLVGDGFFGGDAATTAAERAAGYAPDLDVRGVVAADAGGGDDEAALRDLIAAGPSGGVSGLLQTIAGFSVAYPELQPEDILTPLGLEDLRLVDVTCWTELHDAVDGHPVDDVLAVNPIDMPAWAARTASMRVGAAPYPTLLMASGPLASAADLSLTAARFCHGNDAILLRGYPAARTDARDMGNDPRQGVFIVGWPDVRPWIEDRFAGAPATGNCDR